MERNVYILLVLLVGTSSLSLFLYQRDNIDASPQSAVVIWNFQTEDLTSFSFSSPAFQIEIVPKEDSFGRYWIAQSERKIPRETLKDGKNIQGVADKDTTLISENSSIQSRSKSFVLGLTGRSFLKNIAPLRVKTVVKNTEGREEEFGFEKPVGEFTIETYKNKRDYRIGKKGYGSHVRYIQDKKGTIYAMDERIISGLLSADTRFEQKIVFARESGDLTSFSIINREHPISMKQKRRAGESYWTLNEGQEESIRTRSWIESKQLTMTGAGFVPASLRPKNLETLLEFEMELRGVDKKIGGKIFQKNDKSRPVYFLKTDLTRELVKMKKGEVSDLIESIGSLE